ncbi:MAG: D-2-hydroxyacid dehydrogenase [Tissierellaceae bacterium]|nr:D-2-hydroxyacid dehydrogenase [Tissierellaceae bacterium]
MRILANDGLDIEAIEKLERNNIEVNANHYEKDELNKIIGNYDILIIRSATTVDKELIEAAKGTKLSLIIRAGVGLDNIEVGYAENKGIMVRNTPNSSTNSVAELVLGHMIGISRFINISNVTMREGQWNKKAYTGVEICGKTLGIIGFGRIGKSLGEKAEALGMDVVFYDKLIKIDNKFKYLPLEELLGKADFISLHIPATHKPIIGEEELKLMKEGVFIINAARGGIIDENALLESLNQGKVAGAGLDVFMREPGPNLELCSHPRVSCTPHIGAATVEAQKRIGEEIIGIVMEYATKTKTIAI